VWSNKENDFPVLNLIMHLVRVDEGRRDWRGQAGGENEGRRVGRDGLRGRDEGRRVDHVGVEEGEGGVDRVEGRQGKLVGVVNNEVYNEVYFLHSQSCH
jgi:hypothetical protein